MSATESSMPTTGRWGWYKDHEGVERQRMSKLLEHIDTDRFYLDRYKTGQVVIGMASRDDLIVAAKAIGRPGKDGFTRSQKDQIYAIAAKADEAAKDSDGAVTGTAVHTLTERLDRGEPLADVIAGMPYPWNASLQAYEALRRLNGWQSVEIERTVEIEELDVRGSFDRIDYVPMIHELIGASECQYGHDVGYHHEADEEYGGLPVIVDVKTEEKPWLNGIHIAPQLAGYSRARKMWRPDNGGEYVPMPCVRQDVGVVVHVRDGDAVPYFVNLHEGWEAVVAAAQQRDRQKRAKLALGVRGAWFAPLPNVKRPAPAQLAVEAAVMRDEQAAARDAGVVLSLLPPADRAIDAAFNTPPPVTDTTALPVLGTTVAPAPAADVEASHRKFLIEQVWLCDSRDMLAALYASQQEIGFPVPWSGAVAMAGEARLRIVECVQRSMHSPATTAKCACGWTRDVRP